MSYYVAAYDTEAVYPWWDRPRDGFSYTPEHIAEFLEGVRAVAEAHLQRDAPASFFLVARMLELAGPELRAILDHPLFDIQCHTFTHPNLIALREDRAALQYELGDAKKLIEDTFGREVIGLTAPGGYTDGFRGQPGILEVMWEAGYRYVRSVGKGPKGTLPALLDQPFWYAEDGFPDLLETPSHAWHDNVPDRSAGNGALAAASALALPRRRCRATREGCTKPTRRASTTARGRGFSTTCPSFTRGRSTGSTSRPPRSLFCSIMPGRRWR